MGSFIAAHSLGCHRVRLDDCAKDRNARFSLIDAQQLREQSLPSGWTCVCLDRNVWLIPLRLL